MIGIERIEDEPLTQPDISVVIPFYNVDEYLDECIQSLLGQKGVSLEIIFVDDGSTDNSIEIVRSYMANHDNMKMLESGHRGPGYARNIGTSHAHGEYIAFLDSDDKLVPGIYKLMLRAIKKKEADLCICNAARFNSQKVWGSVLHEKAFRKYKHCTHITKTPELVYDTTVWNKLIKRSFYTEQSIRFPEDRLYEDIETSLNMHLRCNKVVMIPETGYLWRVREADTEASITQQHYTVRNEKDRFRAAEGIIEIIRQEQLPEALLEMFYYKLLETDLKLVLDTATYVTDEIAEEIYTKVRRLIKANIPDDTFERLSLADRQRYDCMDRNDIDGHRRLISYLNNYIKAPLREEDGKLLAKLPDDIFTIKERDVRPELSLLPRRTFVDRIEVAEHSIRVFAHLYLHRYNMANKEDLDIKVFLLNEETGKKQWVDCEHEPTVFLTESFGHVEDKYTGDVTEYNYDWTGFSFSVDTEMFRKYFEKNPKKTRRYAVIAEYNDRLFSGTQIILGVAERNKWAFNAVKVTHEALQVKVMFGAHDELLFVTRRDKSWQAEMDPGLVAIDV